MIVTAIEISCAKCGHQAVCSFKEDFAAAQRAIEQLKIQPHGMVCYGNDTDPGIPVRNLDWLSITPRCKHFCSLAAVRTDLSIPPTGGATIHRGSRVK